MWFSVLQSVNNSLNNNKGETHCSGNQECQHLQQNLNGGPLGGIRLSNDAEGSNYWKNLVAELMKRNPPYL